VRDVRRFTSERPDGGRSSRVGHASEACYGEDKGGQVGGGITEDLLLPAGARFAKLTIGCIVLRPGFAIFSSNFDDGRVVQLDETGLMPGSTLDELTTRTRSAVAELWRRWR
jgi:hypothetical protein